MFSIWRGNVVTKSKSCLVFSLNTHISRSNLSKIPESVVLVQFWPCFPIWRGNVVTKSKSCLVFSLSTHISHSNLSKMPESPVLVQFRPKSRHYLVDLPSGFQLVKAEAFALKCVLSCDFKAHSITSSFHNNTHYLIFPSPSLSGDQNC